MSFVETAHAVLGVLGDAAAAYAAQRGPAAANAAARPAAADDLASNVGRWIDVVDRGIDVARKGIETLEQAVGLLRDAGLVDPAGGGAQRAQGDADRQKVDDAAAKLRGTARMDHRDLLFAMKLDQHDRLVRRSQAMLTASQARGDVFAQFGKNAARR